MIIVYDIVAISKGLSDSRRDQHYHASSVNPFDPQKQLLRSFQILSFLVKFTDRVLFLETGRYSSQSCSNSRMKSSGVITSTSLTHSKCFRLYVSKVVPANSACEPIM